MSTTKRRDRRENKSRNVLLVPLAFSAGLLALTLLPRLQRSEALLWSFWGSGAVLLGWLALLSVRAFKEGAPSIHLAPPRPQHYIQACCHLTVYAYWGYYWRPVYDYAPLLIGQLFFAYAFDLLLSWSRRQSYGLGLGPFPIIFSTNLFLWFVDDWFAFQFLLVALGFAGKAFVRWERDGKRVHIFNPSAFSLAIFSVVLLTTGTTSLTWGQEIATTFSLGPHIYTVLFLVGLVVMFFFSITPVTAMAALTLFGGSLIYTAITGVPYFVDSDIPSAVFLGVHLLVTDPSTSPRTPLGRAIFGVLYGLGVFGLYALLGALGMPTFYDKLLCVPLLNLAVPAIDRAVRALGDKPWLHTLGLDPPLGRANLAHMAVWVFIFGVMTSVGAADGRHKGDSLPFWEQACAADKPQACARLLRIEASYCGDNAGWACNELGRHYTEGKLVPPDRERAFAYFSRACEARFQAGCVNLLEASSPATANPRAFDLRLLVREGGPNLMTTPEPEVRAGLPAWLGVRMQRGDAAMKVLAILALFATVGLGLEARQDNAPLPDFVEIPAGPFTMGADPAVDPRAFDNEKWSRSASDGRVDLPAFYLARHEVTVAQYAAFVRATKAPVDPNTLAGQPTHPVTFVTWPNALAYARWLESVLAKQAGPTGDLVRAGWRVTLPTEAQWEKAARGGDRRAYPWGDQPRQDRGNFAGTGTTPVGQYSCPECSYGLADMSGNVWEWTSSPYQPYPYDPTDDRANLAADALWVMRGGHYGDPARTVRTTTRGAADPGARRAFIGFRVALVSR